MAFIESQKIDLAWAKVLYILSCGGCLILAGQGILEHATTENMLILIGLFLFIIAIYFLVFEMKAETRIDTQGISYKYWPMVPKWKLIPWREIESTEVRKITPLTDYGGWGYKFGKSGGGIILSDEALIIKRKGKKNFVISTRQSARLQNEVAKHQSEEEM